MGYPTPSQVPPKRNRKPRFSPLSGASLLTAALGLNVSNTLVRFRRVTVWASLFRQEKKVVLLITEPRPCIRDRKRLRSLATPEAVSVWIVRLPVRGWCLQRRVAYAGDAAPKAMSDSEMDRVTAGRAFLFGTRGTSTFRIDLPSQASKANGANNTGDSNSSRHKPPRLF
jgi:hypothetical protein